MVLIKLYSLINTSVVSTPAVADPGFPVGGGVNLVGGAWTPEQSLRFKNFECQNEGV